MNDLLLTQIAALEKRVIRALGLVAQKNVRIIELEAEIAEHQITIGVLNDRIVELEADATEVHLEQQAMRERRQLL